MGIQKDDDWNDAIWRQKGYQKMTNNALNGTLQDRY
jgi:hypothetical protein